MEKNNKNTFQSITLENTAKPVESTNKTEIEKSSKELYISEYITDQGVLKHQDIVDIDDKPIQLEIDDTGSHWTTTLDNIRFGTVVFSNTEVMLDRDKLIVCGDSMIGGIELTFWYENDNDFFVSEEEINIIHMATGLTHTLTDFKITTNGSITANLRNSIFEDQNIQLKYDENSDVWMSIKASNILFGKTTLYDANIVLDDYDFILKSRLFFNDNIIEFRLENFQKSDPHFVSYTPELKIGQHILTQGKIIIDKKGIKEAKGIFGKENFQLTFFNDKFETTHEETKKYKAPVRGFFKIDQYYSLQETKKYEIDVLTKELDVKTIKVKITSPYVSLNQKNPTNFQSPTIELSKKDTNGIYTGEIDQQTVRYLGKNKSQEIDYLFEEAKKYEYDPKTQKLTVCTKYLKGHGSFFSRKLYNQYYENFEHKAHITGCWPFRIITYNYYSQVLRSR